MSASSVLVRLAENNAWSNYRLYRSCERLHEGELEAKRTSFFPSLVETLQHIVAVDLYYLDALENGGLGLSIFDEALPTTAGSLEALQRKADTRFVAFTRTLSDADLAREVRIPRRDHVQVDDVTNVVLHLSAHQIHHRGQVHAMLSGSSVAPHQLDEFFMKEELPLREAELRAIGLPLR